MMSIGITESNVERLRDPFVLVENGKYYMYGSGWIAYKSDGNLTKWERLENELVIAPSDFEKNRWAPEVHKYKGEYYMFTTYYSSVTKHRGCTILKSCSPEGPFRQISAGHVTPADWDSIDGTFFIDSEGQNWMIFVHEWTSTFDGIGTMAAAKLSDDLTHFISEPIELFRADDPKWANNRVTDGCYMYTTGGGGLLMIWSNFEGDENYCVGIAHSENGRVDGKWVQEERLLFSKEISGKYDGGHGMIFTGLDGKKYLSIHSPQKITEKGEKEKPVFIPITERNGSIECETV